mgnify:CR=1 FL=1
MPEEHNIENLGMYAISIGTAIIIVAFMTILIQSMRDDTGIIPDQTAIFGGANASNQSLTWAGNNTRISLLEARTFDLILYHNGSKINKGRNYTVNDDSVTILNESTSGVVGAQSGWVTNTLNASYSYYFGSAARNTTNQGLLGQTTFASFLPLVAIALAGALIIGITLRYFRRKELD